VVRAADPYGCNLDFLDRVFYMIAYIIYSIFKRRPKCNGLACLSQNKKVSVFVRNNLISKNKLKSTADCNGQRTTG
jgi:hypothetical protein